jgi:hypothetical protein
MDKLRDHIVILFEFEQVFQVNTFIKPSVVKEIRRTIRMNDRTCIMVNDKHFNVHVHMFLHVMLRITYTLHSLLIIIT